MLVPVIEYIVRAPTSVRAYPDVHAPAVGSVPKRKILIALELRCDHSGHMWVQFRDSILTLNSKLGWVMVESHWDARSHGGNLPQKLGVPRDIALVERTPEKGSTIGVTFSDSPQPVFLLSRYDSANNNDIHWRHAFAKARINCGVVVCPTTMFAVRQTL
jgi:hypothetical protein